MNNYSKLKTVVEFNSDIHYDVLNVMYQVECIIESDDTPKFDILGFCGNERENKTIVSHAIENSGYKMPVSVTLNVIPDQLLQNLIDKRNPHVRRYLPEHRIQSALALAILSASHQIETCGDTFVPSCMLCLDGGMRNVSNSAWRCIERACDDEDYYCHTLKDLIHKCYKPNK